MNRRRGQLKKLLDIGLRRRPPVHQRVCVDEREILSLPGRELRVRIRRAIHDWPRKGGGPAMNIRYRVELNEAERVQLTSMLSGGLAQYGGNRNRRVAWPMSGSPHRRAYPDTAKK